MVEIVRGCDAKIRERIIVSSPKGYIKDVLLCQRMRVFDSFKGDCVEDRKETPGKKLLPWLT